MYKKPILTTTFSESEEVYLHTDSSFIYSESSEDRTRHLTSINMRPDLSYIRISDQDSASFNFHDSIQSKKVNLRSNENLNDFVRQLKPILYVDITGIDHQIWAILLKKAIELGKYVYVIYVEPKFYEIKDYNFTSNLFNLDEDYEGIKSVSGFTSFRESSPENTLLIPILGFQGDRFSYLLEHIEHVQENVFPIIGLPGSRIEYFHFAYWANIRPLKNSNSWVNALFIPATCPFSVYYRIQEISNRNNIDLVKITLTGTKPHSLGAVMFSIFGQKRVELIYDYRKKKLDLVNGVSCVNVYRISEFTSGYRA